MTKNSDISSAFATVRNILLNDAGENYDMTVTFTGTLHNKKGFEIQIENVEELSSSSMAYWSTQALKGGLILTFKQDFTNGVVYGTCYFIEAPIRATCYKCPHLEVNFKWSLLYLSMWICSSVELCRQHNLVNL